MKRATTMLGALALMTAGFLFAAPAAHATVTCNPYPVPPLADTPVSKINDWPRIKQKNSNPAVSHVYNCYPNGSGGTQTTSEFHQMWQGAQAIGRHGTNNPPYYLANEYYQKGTRIYFFKNVTDLNSYWGTSYAPSGKFFGVTLRTVDNAQNPNIPVGSVGIVREHTDGTVYLGTTVKGTVFHELGHAFDLMKNGPASNPGSHWSSAKANDIYDLDHKTRAAAFPSNLVTIRKECKDQFNAAWDPVTQQGVSNWTVARCQWPYQTSDREFFSNIFGQRLGGIGGTTDNQQLLEFSIWMTNKYWNETRDYMDGIDWTGYTP